MRITSGKGGLARLLPCYRADGPFHLEMHPWSPPHGLSGAGTSGTGGPAPSPCAYPCTQVIPFVFSFGEAEALRTKIR